MRSQFSSYVYMLVRMAWIAVLLAPTYLASPFYPVRAQSTDWALQFDGTTDLVQLHPTHEMMGSGWEDEKSVNLWVKPTGGNHCGFSNEASCTSIFADMPHYWGIMIGSFQIYPGIQKDNIWVWNWDGDLDYIGVDYIPGEWVNVALVHSAGILYVYKNGFLRGSVPSGTTMQPFGNDHILYFGGYLSGLEQVQVFNGQIDELHIWNRALSAPEITQQMYQPPENLTGLVAYYKMSDGPTNPITTTLTDDSGHGWTGTLRDGGNYVPGNGTYPEWVISEALLTITPPDFPPSGLTVSSITPFKVDLAWTDNSSNESDFEIMRCTGADCVSFSFLAAVSANTQIYSDTEVTPMTTYCYKVHATNAGGVTEDTNTACATAAFRLYIPILTRE